MTPVSTSPVPAVASAGSPRTDRDPPGRVGDERVVSLEHDDRLRALRGRGAHVPQTVRSISSLSSLKQPPQLTGVGRQHGRRLALAASSLEPPGGVGVEPIRVEHQRNRGLRGQLAGERHALGARPRPGPSTSAPPARAKRLQYARPRIHAPGPPRRRAARRVITSSSSRAMIGPATRPARHAVT